MGMEIVEEYIKIGDYTNAIKFLNSMIEREPHNNDARLKLVGLYSKQKEPDYHAIKKVLREGEALVPNDTKIKLALAKFYMRRENIESASQINIQLGVRISEFDKFEYIDFHSNTH